jgi:hypothetical protein
MMVDSPNLEVFATIKLRLKLLLLITSFQFVVVRQVFIHHFTLAFILLLKSNCLPLLIEGPTSIIILTVSLLKLTIRQGCLPFLLVLLLFYSLPIHQPNPPNFQSTLHPVFPLRWALK